MHAPLPETVCRVMWHLITKLDCTSALPLEELVWLVWTIMVHNCQHVIDGVMVSYASRDWLILVRSLVLGMGC